MTRVLIADTETTGLGPDARIVEYAHVEVALQDGRLVERSRFETLINPGMPIPADASKVHQIFDNMVVDAPALSEVLPAALKMVKNEHFILIGHNFPSYDMKYLDGLIPKSADVGCTLKAARVFINSPKHSLDFLREHLKLEQMGQPHSALADCLDTLQVANHMLTLTSWDILSSCMLQRPDTITFGKHKGKKLEDLDDGYVRWLLEDCDSLSWDLRRALVEM